MNDSNLSKDDRMLALEEKYKSLIEEKDVIIQRYNKKVNEMSQEL